MLAKAILRALEPRTLESPRTPITGGNIDAYAGGNGSRKSRSGVSVGAFEALTYSPVWSAVALISEDIMKIPFLTYERKMVNDREHRREAVNHSVHRILNGAIAPMGEAGRITSDVWIQRMLAHALLFRGAYSRIYRNNAEVSRLEWLHSDRVNEVTEQGKKYFYVTYDGHNHMPNRKGVDRVPEADMFFIDGLSIDDHGGLCLIDFARNSIGRHLAAEDYGDEFFNNAGVPNGWFETDIPMTDPAIKRFMNRVIRAHGPGSRHKFGLLDEGIKWKASGISPKDAMLIELMQFGIPEVARWFRIPLNKLADPSRSGYNTTEQENLSFLGSTLQAWISRLEFQADDKLFSEKSKETRRYYTKFKISEYLRTDRSSLAEFYTKAATGGWMTRNEIRAAEDLNPIEGLDEPLTPANMNAGAEPEPEETPEPAAAAEPETQEPNDERNNAQFVAAVGVVRAAVDECATRLRRHAERAAKKPDTYMRSLNLFEQDHTDTIRRKLESVCMLAGSFGGELDATEATRELINLAREEYLRASECQPGKLEASVASVSLEAAVGQICGGVF